MAQDRAESNYDARDSSSREPHHLSQLYIASLFEVAWLLTGFRQPRGLLLNRPTWAVTWLQLQ